MMRQWPPQGAKSDIYQIPMGINCVDDLVNIKTGYAQRLKDMEYQNGTLARRPPFLEYSTEKFQAVISNAIEYVDTNDSASLLMGSMDGKILKRTDAASHSEDVIGLTVNKRASLCQMLGTAFHQNGADSPRRCDVSTWRVAGAPTAAGTLSLGSASGGTPDGTFIWMVTACIQDGSSVILESDHSNYVTAVLSSEQQALSWLASSDTRVNWYRLYRTKNLQGEPFYLVYEANVLTYTDNVGDDSLSAQLAVPILRNGPMPISRLVAQCGERLVCAGLLDATDPNADKAVHVSIVTTNHYEMEYFPTDGIHKFYLPGIGKATAIFGYSVKDEDRAAKDLFVGQAGSCFILRATDPFGVLEPVSFERGPVSDRAITQWGRFLFFISRQGLEFLGPDGELHLVSKHVHSFFHGGGTLHLNTSANDDYLTLAIHDNRLIITICDDSAKIWGNKALILDLNAFNAFSTAPNESAVFTEWVGEGLGHAFYLPLRNNTLLLFDNQNQRILYRGATGSSDYVNGVATQIAALIWTGGLILGWMSGLKALHQMNVIQVCEKDTLVNLEADYGRRRITNQTIPRQVETVPTDKPWNKVLVKSHVFASGLAVPRQIRGRFFQAKFTIANASETYVFIGLTLFFSATQARRLVHR